jgi:outer membrane protein assembly factor BamA
MKFLFGFFLMLGSPFLYYLQAQDSLKREIPVKGWDYDVVPSFAYNPDRGVQYGALGSIYYYGDGSKYPDYLDNLYLLFFLTTRKGYATHIFFDSKHLFNGKIRFIMDMSFRRNQYEQFYGANGYNSDYQKDYEDPSKKGFISRQYYTVDKACNAILINVQGKFPLPHLGWNLGVGHYKARYRPYLNNGTVKNDLTLFEKYISNEVIPPSQKNGGVTTYLKAGIIFDSRDDESIPTRGIWFEGIYCNAPGFLQNKLPYSQATLTYRQYFSLNPKLVFAYRLAYQTLINGQMPYYMLPYLLSTYWTTEALGGVKSIRGVHNQRLQGNGYTLANFEFRYFLLNTILLKKNLGIALNAFTDMGTVSNEYKISPALNYANFDYMPNNEKIHYGVGGGIRLILNHNFIGAFDCGQPLNKQDGKTAFYIDFDYLF